MESDGRGAAASVRRAFGEARRARCGPLGGPQLLTRSGKSDVDPDRRLEAAGPYLSKGVVPTHMRAQATNDLGQRRTSRVG